MSESSLIYGWIYALPGFIVMFRMLAGIGINNHRGISVKTWCYGYLGIAIGFDILALIAIVEASQFIWLTNLLLGLAAGASTGLAFHVAHHTSQADGKESLKQMKMMASKVNSTPKEQGCRDLITQTPPFFRTTLPKFGPKILSCETRKHYKLILG